MNIFKIIDTFFFGTEDMQCEFEHREKLWFYVPMVFGLAVSLFIGVTVYF